MVSNQINLSSFISTVTTITFACGIIFQLPIIVYFLTRLGVLSPETMKYYRAHSIIGALIISAVITPPDLSSQILVTLPLLVLYEISIYISKFVLKNLILSMKLRAEQIIKNYGDRSVVKGVSLEVNQGEIVGLLGPNGAGKTTTFYMIVGLIRPSSGHVYLDGDDITNHPMYVRAQKGIGYLGSRSFSFS